MRYRKRSYILFLFLHCYLFSATQGLVTRQYTSRQNPGLPVDEVFCAAQDGDGFMWFGTALGIAYFDGRDFTHYYRKKGMENKSVMDIKYAKGDSLIFISYPDAIQSIHPGGRIVTLLTGLKKKLGFSPQLIEWYGKGFFIYQRETNVFAFVDEKKQVSILKTDSITGTAGTTINKIISLNYEDEYILCTNKGAFYISQKKGTRAITGALNITCGVYTRSKKIILAGEENIYQSNGPGEKTTALPVPLPDDFLAIHMIEDNDEQILIRGLGRGTFLLGNGKLTDISERLSIENKVVHRFFRDRDNNLWICTNAAGIILKKRTAFSTFDATNALPNDKIEKILQVEKGLLIGTGNGIVLLRPDNRVERIPVPGPPNRSQNVYGIFHAPPLGTSISISNIETSGRPFITQSSIAGPLLLSKTFFSGVVDNAVWVFDEGQKILVYPPGKTTPEKEIDLKDIECRKIYTRILYNEEQWLGTDRGIIRIGKNGKQHIDSVQEQKLEQVFKFIVDRKNTLWIATDNGVFYYYNGSFNRIDIGKDDLENYCTDIVEDNEGNLLIATWDGIVYWKGGTKKKLNIFNGLVSRTVNCLALDETGKKLYAGTNNGLSVLNLEDSVNTFNKRAFIKCYNRDSSIIFGDSTLRSGRYNLTFNITIPEYGDPDEISIQYRLDNGKWVISKNFTININDIRSGKHHFYVKPYLPGNDIEGPVTEFVFTIEKPFYETWWFRTLIIVLSQGLIVWLLVYINKRKRKQVLRKHQQMLELATLRQKAFTTLINPHFIFNALNSIQHYINKQDRQAANRYLSDFASLIRRNFDAAQQAFIPLDEELENIRLYLQLEKMRFPGKFEYDLFVADNVDAEDQFIPSMILQPFLENAILHGLSSRQETGSLNISIEKENDALAITITDNGIGMDKSRATQINSRHKSRGMQLIREKLAVLGRFGDQPIALDITEAFPGSEYPGMNIRILIHDSIYKNFPGEAAVYW